MGNEQSRHSILGGDISKISIWMNIAIGTYDFVNDVNSIACQNIYKHRVLSIIPIIGGFRYPKNEELFSPPIFNILAPLMDENIIPTVLEHATVTLQGSLSFTLVKVVASKSLFCIFCTPTFNDL